MSIVTHVKSDDWEGLYVDGFIQDQNHSLRVDSLGYLVNLFSLEDYRSFYVCGEWMEEQGYLPENIKDIPDEVRQ